MEAAIRWAANAPPDDQQFVVADPSQNYIRSYRVQSLAKNKIDYVQSISREKLQNYTAFDWSTTDPNLAAIGNGFGETRVLKLSSSEGQGLSFPIRQPRKCNSVAFSTRGLLAAAYDRHRADPSVNVYDVRNPLGNAEPVRRLAAADHVFNVKFFSEQPDVMLVGTLAVKGGILRLYDLREQNSSYTAQFLTRNCHFLSIDPLDQNYFASAGRDAENAVSVWDRRLLNRSSASNLSAMAAQSSVMEIKPAIDMTTPASVAGLRHSPYRRGCFAILSTTGQIRLFETGKYPNENSYNSEAPSNNDQEVAYFTKKVHELKAPTAPYLEEVSGKENTIRTVAFDFASHDKLISLRHDRSVEMIEVPVRPPLVIINPMNQIAMFREFSHLTIGPGKSSTIAEDLVAVQSKMILQFKRNANTEVAKGRRGQEVNGLAKALERSRIDDEMAKMSSRKRHEQLLSMGGGSVKLDLKDLLTVQDTQRRRCEEGYLFDCERNGRIVGNDPWLVDLWIVIKRLEDMASDRGMVQGGLDLSYLGVSDIWESRLGSRTSCTLRTTGAHSKPPSAVDVTNSIDQIVTKQKYESFTGADTEYPLHRQLCLIICGWRFSENQLRAKCDEIAERGEHYKSIIVAVCHGRKDIAMDLLKAATRQGNMESGGLAAVIAGDSISKELRSLCEWMAEDARDPYLKALLTHYVTGAWASVIAMTELPLVYRIALALKYLTDAELTRFLSSTTSEAIATGDTEGVVLTGLAERSMDLFQSYIAKSSDLQTAVLATARANPRYVQDERWTAWKEQYFWQMQAWRAFIPRSRFTSQHSRMATRPDGRCMLAPPPRQVALRCSHCQKSIGRRSLDSDGDDTATLSSGGALARNNKSPAAAAGTVCPRCGRPMPRCAVCLLWLGSPDPSQAAGAGALSEAAEADPMAKMVVFCMRCNHGYHGDHARMWFAKRNMCAVADCSCLCGLRGGVENVGWGSR